MTQLLHLHTNENIFEITLTRPECGNALNPDLIRALSNALKNRPLHCRAIVLKGSGKHFCLGADLNWMKDSSTLSGQENLNDVEVLADCLKILYEIPIPIIVWVQGAVFGGGLGLLACADIVYASPNALFCFSETKLGLIPAVISPYVVPKIGYAKALSLYLTAESFDAHKARNIGLIHDILPTEEDFNVSLQQFLKNAPIAQQRAKQFLRHTAHMELKAFIPYSIETLATLRQSEEAQEGLKAFLEKRAPNWIKKL